MRAGVVLVQPETPNAALWPRICQAADDLRQADGAVPLRSHCALAFKRYSRNVAGLSEKVATICLPVLRPLTTLVGGASSSKAHTRDWHLRSGS